MAPSSNANQAVNIFMLKMIWGALLISQAMYFFVASTVIKNTDPATSTFFDPSSPLSVPIAVIAIALLAAAYFIPQFVLRATQKQSALPNSQSRGPLPIEDLLKLYFPSFIIRLALLEAIALLGFVMVITQHDLKRMLPFSAVAVLGFLLNFPTEEKVRSAFVPGGPERI